MSNYLKHIPIICALAIIVACTEPFNFESEQYEKVLVIDGAISDEMKFHTVALSYTYQINSDQPNQNITNAEVYVLTESDEKIEYNLVGDVFKSVSQFKGEYGQKYQLVVIIDGVQYESTKEEMLPSPSIDSIYDKYVSLPSDETKQNEVGIQFFLDTHDDTGKSKYYRYEWEETYQIKVPFPSGYEVIDGSLERREESIGVCYTTEKSNNLIVGTSIQSTQNVISEFPIRNIEQRDKRIRTRYSINVTQFALSEEAYLFYKKVIESSESSGSFFDKQLGTVVGNIKSVNSPNDPVLGYFEVSGTSKMRAFFSSTDFDERFVPAKFEFQCYYSDVLRLSLDSAIQFIPKTDSNYFAFVIVSPPEPFGPDSVDIFSKTCSSCKWYASTKKPVFWIE